MTGPSSATDDEANADEAIKQNPSNNGSSSNALSKAIEVLGPRVPANGAGIVIIVIVAGAALTVAGARNQSAATIIIATVIVVLALVYAFVILVPQWMTEKRNRQDFTQLDRTPPPDTVTVDPETAPETLVATRSLADLLTDEQHDAVCAVVTGATRDAASVIGINSNLVRGNIFASDGTGFLRIMPQFGHNMLFEKERTTKMRINEGSTGHAWFRCRPNIAVRPRERGAVDALSADQTARLAPTLQWIISMPVFAEDGNVTPIWILNVDGLEEPKTAEELEPAVGALLRWAEQLSRILRNVK